MPGFAWRKEKSPGMASARKYSEELLERGTRLVFESSRLIACVGFGHRGACFWWKAAFGHISHTGLAIM
ncbi:MAG: hypothetical protein QOD66_3112 [Solirubrobacteraceae bacterium]|nr:hypothetical protein [Solirubrobacteraceae bacterium]